MQLGSSLDNSGQPHNSRVAMGAIFTYKPKNKKAMTQSQLALALDAAGTAPDPSMYLKLRHMHYEKMIQASQLEKEARRIATTRLNLDFEFSESSTEPWLMPEELAEEALPSITAKADAGTPLTDADRHTIELLYLPVVLRSVLSKA